MSRSGRLAGRTGETSVRLRFGATTVEQQGERYLFHVQVFLDDIDPDAVSAELYAEAQKDEGPITQSMNRGERPVGATSGFTTVLLFRRVARLLTTPHASFRGTYEPSCRNHFRDVSARQRIMFGSLLIKTVPIVSQFETRGTSIRIY